MALLSVGNIKYLPIILLGLIGLFALYLVLRAVLSPLRHVPGPFWARFTRLWYFNKVWNADFQWTNIKLHEKYGPIVRIAPNEYSLNGLEALKTIYGHGTQFTKSNWYIPSTSPRSASQSLFADNDSKRHAANRRKVASLYSMTALLRMEPSVAITTKDLIVKLTELSKNHKMLNLQVWLQYYAFDTISQITLGKTFGLIGAGADYHGFIGALHQYLIYCALVGIYWEIHPVIFKIVSLLPSKGQAWMFGFVNSQVEARIKATYPEKTISSTEDKDFLAQVLELHSLKTDFTMNDVMGACLQNIGAGSDTTSVSLASIMYNLITSPKRLQRLREEIDTVLADNPSGELITFAEAQKMPFLQACIKEGLRVHPATGLPLARVVPEGGSTIMGTYFPAGTVVGVNSWVSHYNKEIYGEDAHLFVPERWLEKNDRTAIMEQAYMPFGLGSRTCIGKNISLMEISRIVPELVRRFDFQLAAPGRPVELENVWFVKQKDIECYVSIRER